MPKTIASPPIFQLRPVTADPSVVAAHRIARRFRLTPSHAVLVAQLAGLGAVAKEARS